MFFFRPPLTSMVFQWFWQRWTITIECFLRAQPLVSMVFRWFSKFWWQWSTMVLRLAMVWMYHWTLKVRKINFRQNTNFEQHFPHGEHDSEMIDHYFYFQILKCRTEEQFKWIIEEETRLLYNSMQMISGMRQVWFATAMHGNKYQGRLTIDFSTKEPNQDCNCDHRIVPFF